MKQIRIGVIGVGRGSSMIEYCLAAGNATIVAICDKWQEGLDRMKRKHPDMDVTYYTDYDEFLKHDMDAVVLANYANEHAPFAIKAMRAGKHVFSEVLPVQNVAEAVALIEAVEETGLTYAYGENYCYMPAPREMRKLYREGRIGEFEYGEGEYVHNCESIWPAITYGEEDHWRNNMFATFYCTHSLGPIIHITGLRPVSVIGFEGAKNDRRLRVGAKVGQYGIEMVTLDNGGVVKSIHGDLYKNSIWYTVYGSMGRMESAREDAENGGVCRIYINADEYDGEYTNRPVVEYEPTDEHSEMAKPFGHGGSDYYCMYNFVQKLLGDPDADIIDVYEAMDMCLPGVFAYRSVLAGGIPVEVPDLRIKENRDKYRDDTACTDPKAAGDKLLPSFSKGTPEIPQEVYDKVRENWEARLEANKDKTVLQ